ncbi:guanyl-specific ribonuclease [Kytococcus sp. Marseille-QA3725]
MSPHIAPDAHQPPHDTPRSRRTILTATLAAALLPLSGLGLAAPTSAATQPAADEIPECSSDVLTPEAHDVIDTISEGGEFQYPDKDGSTFGNREGLLPDESDDYYAEYTVPTPGEDDRGARRIVTGGDTTPTTPDTHPEHWYWTDDHYESFCEFTA